MLVHSRDVLWVELSAPQGTARADTIVAGLSGLDELHPASPIQVLVKLTFSHFHIVMLITEHKGGAWMETPGLSLPGQRNMSLRMEESRPLGCPSSRDACA